VLLALNPLFLAADVFSDDPRASDGGISFPFEPMETALAESSGPGGSDVPNANIGNGGGEFVIEEGVGRVLIDDAGFAFGGPDDEPIIGFDQFGNPIFASQVDDDGPPFWALSVIGLGGLALLAMFIAVRRLRTPAAVER
jgi:hypothetical protein